MADYSLCEYSDCPMSSKCKRFMIKESSNPVTIKFKNICSEKNDYFYIIKMDEVNIVAKEDENT